MRCKKKGDKAMYSNLKTVLIQKRVSMKSVAELLGITEKSIQNKINEKTDFTLAETKKIRALICPEFDFNYLFESTLVQTKVG